LSLWGGCGIPDTLIYEEHAACDKSGAFSRINVDAANGYLRAIGCDMAGRSSGRLHAGCASMELASSFSVVRGRIPARRDPNMPDRAQSVQVSDAALALLHRRLSHERVEVNDQTRPLYRELAAAGLMIPLHTLIGGDESAYRLTDAGVIFARHHASCGASPAPDR
jgi:hypothetical protein